MSKTNRDAPRRGNRRQVPLPVVLVSMLVGGLCALLALNTASAALEVRNRGLTDSNTSASDAEQQLMRDLAAKQAPASLQAAAIALGLVPNQNPAFLRLNADGSVSILGSPTPATAPPVPVKPTPQPTPSSTAPVKPSATPSKPAPAVTVTVTAAPKAPTATASHPPAAPSTPLRATPHPSSTPTGGR